MDQKITNALGCDIHIGSLRPPMRWARLIWLTLLIEAVLAAGATQAAQDPSEGAANLLNAAKEKWMEYRIHSKTFQGKIIRRLEYFAANDDGRIPPPIESHVTIRQNRNCGLLTLTLPMKENSTPEVIAWNSRYSFHLSQAGKPADWLLKEYDGAQKNTLLFFGKTYPQHVEAFSLFALSIDFAMLDRLVDDQRFKITNVAKIDDALLELVFEYPHDTKEMPLTRLQRGKVVLDKRAGWCVREYHGESAAGTVTDAMNEFDYVEGDAILRQAKRVIADKKTGSVLRHEILNFDLKVARQFPVETQFTLSAFGISEPQGVQWKSPSSASNWILLSGIVLTLLGVLMYRSKRWRQISNAAGLALASTSRGVR